LRKTITFLDSGVLISAHRGEPAIRKRALALLDDPGRTFVTSDFVRLEIIPKATYNERSDEVSFYKAFFAIAKVQPISKKLVETALAESIKWGLSAIDAFHVAAAKVKGCGELYTTERLGKPLFRVKNLRVISLA
jgi:predicted nucleic acid-binding protein